MMGNKKYIIPAALAGVLFVYLAAYSAYRIWGPVAKHYSKWGGPPALLVSLESPARKTLYYVFYPCLEVEDWTYRITHDEKQSWNLKKTIPTA